MFGVCVWNLIFRTSEKLLSDKISYLIWNIFRQFHLHKTLICPIKMINFNQGTAVFLPIWLWWAASQANIYTCGSLFLIWVRFAIVNCCFCFCFLFVLYFFTIAVRASIENRVREFGYQMRILCGKVLNWWPISMKAINNWASSPTMDRAVPLKFAMKQKTYHYCEIRPFWLDKMIWPLYHIYTNRTFCTR